MSPSLDPIDSALVDALSADGRATYQQLGSVIGLSPTATADRVRKLCSTGVIRGFRAVVDADRVGRTVEAMIDVRLESGFDRQTFADVLRRMPGVVEAIHVTGHHDYVLRVFCAGTAELDAMLGTLKLQGGVTESQTRLLMHRISGLDPLGPSLESAAPTI